MRALIAALLLGGCTTTYTAIDYSRPPPADWPTLREEVFYVPLAEIGTFCRHTKVSGVVGCARLGFVEGVCGILIPKEAPNHAALLEHERGHCRGYDHPGETTTRDAWERHKRDR